MRLLILSDERWDSGLSRYALDLGLALRAREHSVHFWGLKGRPPYQAAAQAGFSVYDSSRPWRRIRELRQYLLGHSIELLNAHTGSTHSLAAFLSRTLSSRPAVVRTRGDARALRRRLLGRWLLKRTNGTICANRKILQEFQETYPSLPTPAETIPPGIDPASFEAQSLPRRPSVGLVARLDPVKGQDDFLKAAALIKKNLPAAEFWLAGPEENIKLQDLERQAQNLGLGPETHLLGRVERVDRVMALCRIGVVSSKASEAVSRVALEWMASGRALVATAVGNLPELVEEGTTGFLVPPERPELLAEKLLELLQNPEQARGMGERARRRVELEFSLGAFGLRSERFLESVLREKRGRPHG